MSCRIVRVVSAAALVFVLAACGDDAVTDPVDVQLGETTFVFVVNPTINDATDPPESVPSPGPNRGGVDVTIQDGPSGTTGSDLTLDGSDAVLLNNAVCGSVSIDGSGTIALGNAGMAPVETPSGGC